MTSRWRGSYEPAPAPTLRTDLQAPNAVPISAAILGSGWRERVYAFPMVS